MDPIHVMDAQCDVDPETGCCRECGVDHSGPACLTCGGRGFHYEPCEMSDDAPEVA